MNFLSRPTMDDFRNLLRGLSMGCADVVPGVSGGTVALILGIYVRLVTAISHIDGSCWRLIRAGKWGQVTDYLDLRFLLALGTGIVTGIVAMSLVINQLLGQPSSRALTLAVFFGMIAASAILLAKTIRANTRSELAQAWIIGIAAALFAWWASSLAQSTSGIPSLPWLFVCGAIGICAMILPGISGAMILLVLGVYGHLTEVPRNLLEGIEVSQSLQRLIAFGCGCATGLITFSKILRWLLSNHHTMTMSALCGFMVGALVKLWPFQVDLTTEQEKIKHKTFELVWPTTIDGQTLAVFSLIISSAVFVFVVDGFTNRRSSQTPHD